MIKYFKWMFTEISEGIKETTIKNKYKLLISSLVLLLTIASFVFVHSVYFKELNQFEELSKLGEYLNGTVGILLTAAGILGILIAYLSQREQLKIQQEELENNRVNNDILKFENNFFQLLNNFQKIINNFEFEITFNTVSGGLKALGRKVTGREAIKYLYTDFYISIPKKDKTSIHWNDFNKAYEEYMKINIYYISHYFRNLFHILKLIYRNRFLFKEDEFYYSSIVRSQLSKYELLLLFFNSVSSYGNYNSNKLNFKFFIERYTLFEHIHDEDIKSYFSHCFTPSAFKNPIDICTEIIASFKGFKLCNVEIDINSTYSSIHFEKYNDSLTKEDIYYEASFEHGDLIYELSFVNDKTIEPKIRNYLKNIVSQKPCGFITTLNTEN